MKLTMEASDYMKALGEQRQIGESQSKALAVDLQAQDEMSLGLIGQILTIRRLLIDAGVPADLMAEADKIIGPEILSSGSSRA